MSNTSKCIQFNIIASIGKALDNIDLNQMSHRYVSGVLQNDFPQALYILRNLEKFENSIKIHFFIREIAANFNNFQGSSSSAQKLLLTWYCTCIYQLPKALTLRKMSGNDNFCNSFRRSFFAPWWCAVLAVKITPNFKGKKSILVLTLAKKKELNIAPRGHRKRQEREMWTKRKPCKQRRKSHQSYFQPTKAQRNDGNFGI